MKPIWKQIPDTWE